MSPCNGPSHQVYTSLESPDPGSRQPFSWCCGEGLQASHRGLSGTLLLHTPSRGLAEFLVSGFGGALPGTLFGFSPEAFTVQTAGWDFPPGSQCPRRRGGTGAAKTGSEVCPPASVLGWSAVTSHQRQVFLGEGKT